MEQNGMIIIPRLYSIIFPLIPILVCFLFVESLIPKLESPFPSPQEWHSTLLLRVNGDYRCWCHRSHGRNHRSYDLPGVQGNDNNGDESSTQETRIYQGSSNRIKGQPHNEENTEN